MLYVNFNAYANYVTDSLYQWDVNRTLIINGLGLTEAPEIHFTNAAIGGAIVRKSTVDNGVITARIPNSLLQYALTIKAYIGVYEGEVFRTIETIEIPVIARNRPFDYVLTDSDDEIYSFKALEKKVDEAKNEYVALKNVAAEIAAHPPKIGDTTNTWFFWDVESASYVDSGKIAIPDTDEIVNDVLAALPMANGVSF